MARPILKFKPISSTIHKLQNGQVYKNYVDLCNILEQPIANGNSKTSQLKMFERYFEYHKDGYKIIIDNVFSEPLLEDSNDYYSTLIQKLILDYICANGVYKKTPVMLFSKNQLSNIIGLTKDEYISHKKYHSTLSDLLDTPINVVDEFYSMTNERIDSYLKTALKALDKMSVIDFAPQKRIIKIKNKHQIRVATNYEIEVITESEYLSLKDLMNEDDVKNKKILTLNHVKFRNQMDKFYKLVDKHLMDDFGIDYIDYYYSGYQVILTNNVADAKDRLDGYILANKKEISDALNKIFSDRYKQSYVTRNEQAITEMAKDDYGFFREITLGMRAGGNYTRYGNTLIDATINKERNFKDYVVEKETEDYSEIPFMN